MTKLRLAVLNTQSPQHYFGGVERRIREVTLRIQNEVDSTIYSGTKAGFKTDETINGVNYVPCKSTDRLFPLDNWTYNRSVVKKQELYKADVFEIHNNSAYGFPKVLEKRGKNKSLIHVVHGPLKDEYEQGLKNKNQSFHAKIANLFMRYQARQEETMTKKASLIVAVSKYSKNRILEHYGVEEQKIRIIPNGVDVEKFKSIDTAKVKRQLGFGEEPIVLFVGSLIPRKGLPYLIESAKKIVKQRANTKFLIVGNGPLREQLDELLSTAGLLGNFTFLNKLDESQLMGIYNAADVFTLPSLQEGQGIVLLEAQACGKPVVAFGVGGVTEAVRDKETGYLYELGDVEGFADGILKLLNDEMLRQKMGAAGHKFVTENFSWDLCAQRMLEVYQKQLS